MDLCPSLDPGSNELNDFWDASLTHHDFFDYLCA
jgi:hypothetical protein